MMAAACGVTGVTVERAPTPAVASNAVAAAPTEPPPTATAPPTATPAPTYTPEPTHTPAPTYTPAPTQTPAPTNTAVATNTPAPNTPTPEPQPTDTPVPPTHTPTNTPVPPTPVPTDTPVPPTPTPAPTDTPAPTPTQAFFDDTPGRTMENPIPIRRPGRLTEPGGLVLRVTKVHWGHDAIELLDEANNPDPPLPDGHHFVLIRITMQNNGREDVTFPTYDRLSVLADVGGVWPSEYHNIEGKSGEGYGDDCRKLPSRLHSDRPIERDGNQHGYVCFIVRAEDAGKLVLADNGGSQEISDAWRFFALR